MAKKFNVLLQLCSVCQILPEHTLCKILFFSLSVMLLCNFLSILLLTFKSVMAELLSKALISQRPQAQPINIHMLNF